MVQLRAEHRHDGNTSTAGYPSDWRSAAACTTAGVDPELFFPVGRQGRKRLAGDPDPAERAKSICRACPAVRDCLREAISNDVEGVWGGTTYDEREQLREQYGITPAPITIRHLSEVDRLHQVAFLDRGGSSAAEIAAQLNTTPRNVQRMRTLNRRYQRDRIA